MTMNEMFDIITQVQRAVSWVVGEFSLYDVMGFYLLACGALYVITSQRRAEGARIWVSILMTLSLGFERILYNYLMDSGYPYAPVRINPTILSNFHSYLLASLMYLIVWDSKTCLL